MKISKRLRFFSIHFSLSLLIALVVLFFIFFIWYPQPIATDEGVGIIAVMLIAIDVIVGPVLAFLVYKEEKKSLKMDLGVILILQILAMGYGLFSIVSSRPVWIVQNGAIFQLVRANAILPRDQEQAKENYKNNGWLSPQWVAVDTDNSKYEYYAEQTLVPNLYVDLSFAKPRIQNYAQDLKNLYAFNQADVIATELKKFPQANAWMPLRTTGLGLVVLLDRSNAKVVGIANLRPWKES